MFLRCPFTWNTSAFAFSNELKMRLSRLRLLLRKQRRLWLLQRRLKRVRTLCLSNPPRCYQNYIPVSLLTLPVFPTLISSAIAEGTPDQISDHSSNHNKNKNHHIHSRGNWYDRSSSAQSTQAGLCYLARKQESSHQNDIIEEDSIHRTDESSESSESNPSVINPQPWYKEFSAVLDRHDPRKNKKYQRQSHTDEAGYKKSKNKNNNNNNKKKESSSSGDWFEQFAESLEGSVAGSPILFDEDVLSQIKDKLGKPSERDRKLLSQLTPDNLAVNPTELAFSPIVNEPWSLDSEPSTVQDVSLTEEDRQSMDEDCYETSTLGHSIIKRDENSVSVQRPRYFTSHKSCNLDPTRMVEYEFAGRLSAVINAYKLAQVPSLLLESDEEFQRENQFHSRTLTKHDILDDSRKERLMFRVVLKPLDFLSGVPLLSQLANSLAIVAYEDWLVDMQSGRAECIITNETFRGAFAVDEFCVFEQRNEHRSVDIYKSLYVSTFVDFPSLLFYKYSDYSDTYISVIAKLANSHVCGGGPRRNLRRT